VPTAIIDISFQAAFYRENKREDIMKMASNIGFVNHPGVVNSIKYNLSELKVTE